MALYQDLVEGWTGLPYKTRKNLRLAAIGIVFLGGAFLIVNATRSNLNKGRGQAGVKEDTSVLLAPPSNLRAQDLANQIRALNQEVAKLQDQVKFSSGLTEGQIAAYMKDHPIKPVSEPATAAPAQASEPARLSPADQARLEAMQAQLAALQAQLAAKGHTQGAVAALPAAPSAPSIYEIGGQGINPGGSLSPAGQSAAIPPSPASSGAPAAIPKAPKAPKTIVHVDAQAPKGVMQGLGHLGGQPEEQGHLDATVGVNDKDRVYLPAGTIITGVTLNGVNVGTGPAAMSNPQIVDLRVKKPAIMPNGYRVNLNNCMIINTGYGNLASERVYLRPTLLSCVNEQGKVIEATIRGYVVGDDGISGLPGVVVDHQGALIAKGFIAGLFSGLGGAFSPQAVTPIQINPGATTQYQYPSASMLAGSAVSGGVNNAAGQIAKFYIDEAKALQPTLQINPGVSADLILESGAYVQKKGMTKAQLQKTAWEASTAANPAAGSSPQQQAQSTLSGIPTAKPVAQAPTEE